MSGALRQTSGLTAAWRTDNLTFPVRKGGSSLASRRGLNYEKRVNTALALAAKRVGGEFIAQPHYGFEDENGGGFVIPDGLFILGTWAVVIEIKLTFVPEAITKLRGLYVPVVELAERVLQVAPLVICHTLTPEATALVRAIGMAMTYEGSVVPSLLWLGRERLEW